MHNRTMDFLIIDDEMINVIILEELIRELGHTPISYTDPLAALQYIEHNEVDVIIIDYMMPDLDGISLSKKIKAIYPDAVIVMITALGDNIQVKHTALEVGITDFLVKPIDVIEVQLRLKNLAELRYSRNLLKQYNEKLEEDIQKATEQIIKGYHESLLVVSNTAEYRDPETSNHINRVAYYSKLIAEKLNFNEKDQEIIFYASPLHDIGKVAIADDILLKPDKLTDEEFDIMKTHSICGFNILKEASNPYLKVGAQIALSHHEKFNGKGYPYGLSGEEISIYGRITAVADVFDALTSRRSYKRAWPLEEALSYIENEKGEHFDPKIVDIFIENFAQVKEIFYRFNDSE